MFSLHDSGQVGLAPITVHNSAEMQGPTTPSRALRAIIAEAAGGLPGSLDGRWVPYDEWVHAQRWHRL